MDAMVTARVPVEVKKRGDRMLKEIGSSATELVNAAYDYVLKHGRLPREEPAPSPEPEVKTLDAKAASEFRNTWQARSVLEAPSYDGANFRDLLDAARGDRYARFA